MTSNNLNKVILKQMPFQLTAVTLLPVRAILFATNNNSFYLNRLSDIGVLIAVYCLVKIYILNYEKNELITTGLFRFTRHPMYTGLFLADLRWFQQINYNPLFFTTFIAFLVTLGLAAYFQEQEVLCRWGEQAKRYYEKTPRLFLLYPYYYFQSRKNDTKTP